MKYIDLYEQFIPKLSDEPIEVSSIGVFGQRITNKGTNKIRKQDMIVATDDTIKKIVKDEIARLGKDANLNHIDVSRVTNMDSLFAGTDFQSDVSEWDVRNVKVTQWMFGVCPNFNSDISGWNVRNVKDMMSMFRECSKFNGDISGWDVSNVEDTYGMFSNCTNFNCDISSWNVSKVEDTSNMFEGCPIKEEFKPNFNI